VGLEYRFHTFHGLSLVDGCCYGRDILNLQLPCHPTTKPHYHKYIQNIKET